MKKSFHTQNNVKNVLRNIKVSLGYNQGGVLEFDPTPLLTSIFGKSKGGGSTATRAFDKPFRSFTAKV